MNVSSSPTPRCWAEAVKNLQRGHFDVLLLDLSLPDSAGRDTFLQARAEVPHLPIVVLTGIEDEVIGLDAVRHGIQDYLIKGQADGRQIARAIRYAIERKLAEEELQKLNRTLRALGNSNQALMCAREESEFLEKVCKIIVEDCGHAMVWIGYAEKDEGQTVRPSPMPVLRKGISTRSRSPGRIPNATRSDRHGDPHRKTGRVQKHADGSQVQALAGGGINGATSLRSCFRCWPPASPSGPSRSIHGNRTASPNDEKLLLADLAGDIANGIMTIRMRLLHARTEAELLRERNQLETRVRERTAELSRINQSLQAEIAQRQRAEEAHRQVLRQLADAEETERGRISRELHDRLGQDLTGLKLKLQLIQQARDPSHRQSRRAWASWSNWRMA